MINANNAYQATEESLLIERVKFGDRECYRQIVERYSPKLWRMAINMLRDEMEAEDAVQDTMISFWNSKESWSQEGAKFSTWIYKVCLNKCIDIKRKRKNFDRDGLDDLVDNNHSDSEKSAIKDQEDSSLLESINLLPENQKKAIILFYYEELSVKQISDALKSTEGATKALLKRARQNLRKAITDEYKQRKVFENS